MKLKNSLTILFILTLLVTGCDRLQRKTVTLQIQKDKEDYYAHLYAQQEIINQIDAEYDIKKGQYWRAVEAGRYDQVDYHEVNDLADEYIAKLKEHIALQAQYIQVIEKNVHTLVQVLSKP
jgi:hypothetical protein